ncbi:MAG: 30S ribosomal protein S6--L-glutamate ligase [Aeromonadaceae bacterium]
MQLAILSREPNSYTTRRLCQVAEARQHQVRVLDTLRLHLNITPQGPRLFYAGAPLEGIEAVIPRIGASITAYGVSMLRQFELMNITCLNGSDGIACSRDKLRAMQLMAHHGLPLPMTGFAHKLEDVPALIASVGGAPLVVKLLEGSQGIGVALCDSQTSAESVIEAFLHTGQRILVQEFIREAEGSDIRCLVVGDQVVAAIERRAQPGEFRSNLHRGGSASAVALSEEERRVALRAARSLGLDVAGVDILRSRRGPLLMEVNSSPGLQGGENASGINICERILDHLEKKHAGAPG